MKLSVSTISRMRVWVAQRSVGLLLLMWLVLYTTLGLAFAIAYSIPACAVSTQSGNCESQFWNIVFFSFTTKAPSVMGTISQWESGDGYRSSRRFWD
jgi:hypothetical protein